MANYHIPLFPDRIYHIFSRAVGNEKLFRERDNHRYFLEQFHKKAGTVADLLAYCLLPNHFHFLVRIRSENDVKKVFESVKSGKQFSEENCPDFIMERFSNWLNGYTKAFNIRYKRKGALFIDYLRRVEIGKDDQLLNTLFYIHKNPVHHGLVKKIDHWEWSSFREILNEHDRFVSGKEAIDWFGGKDQFEAFHRKPVYLKTDEEMDL